MKQVRHPFENSGVAQNMLSLAQVSRRGKDAASSLLELLETRENS